MESSFKLLSCNNNILIGTFIDGDKHRTVSCYIKEEGGIWHCLGGQFISKKLAVDYGKMRLTKKVVDFDQKVQLV